MALKDLIPMLGVEDVEKSITFYKDALGFEKFQDVEFKGKVAWAIARSADTMLMFTCQPGGAATVADREARKKLYFYFYPDDVVALHAELKEKGYAVTDLRVTFYKMKEFELEDPDGYQLWFGQDSDEPPTKHDHA